MPRPPERLSEHPPYGSKNILEDHGAQALAQWMLDQEPLLLTDTTMRDGHQSLLATRMRSVDMVRVAPAYATNLPQLLSVECWGGATFDVAYRFLQECPWQRLRDLRAAMPNLLTQMLLRASNGVGYTNYPDNVVRAFVRQAAETGIDVFRVFDSLNWVENMRVAMDAVIDTGRVCEGTVCYTGDILDPDRAKYDLKYYVGMARELEQAGAPRARAQGHGRSAQARRPPGVLVKALKDEVGISRSLPHPTTRPASPAPPSSPRPRLEWTRPMSRDGFSVGEHVAGDLRDGRLGVEGRCARYRDRHGRGCGASTPIGMRCAPSTSPSRAGCRRLPPKSICTRCRGGQFTNLKAQARSMGLEERWHDIAQMYADVNAMFGDIVKVTPGLPRWWATWP